MEESEEKDKMARQREFQVHVSPAMTIEQNLQQDLHTVIAKVARAEPADVMADMQSTLQHHAGGRGDLDADIAEKIGDSEASRSLLVVSIWKDAGRLPGLVSIWKDGVYALQALTENPRLRNQAWSSYRTSEVVAGAEVAIR